MATIGVLFNNGRNRRLLTDWISTNTEHDGIEIETGEELSDRAIDLCLIDGYCLDACADSLAQAKADADPRYLPFVLLIERQQVKRLDTAVWDRVDDIIWQSATSLSSADSQQFRFELHGRMESLLETRQATVKVDRQRKLVQVLNRVLRHNLRNDMSIVRGIVTMLEEDLEEPPEYTSSAVDTIDDLLALSEKARQLESIVEGAENRREMDVVPMVERAIEDVESDYPAASIAHETDGDAAVLTNGSVEMAVREVIENAAKHAGEAPSIEVGTCVSGESVRIRVRDDGPGLPEQERDVLQTGVETSLSHGSGLGLWIVYWVVTNHDGAITTDVTEDGTVVELSIPKSLAEEGTGIATGTAIDDFQRHERFETVFEQFPEAIVVLDHDGRIVNANPAAGQLFGRSQDRLLGRRITEYTSTGVDTESDESPPLPTAESGTLSVSREDGTDRSVKYRVVREISPQSHLLVLRDVSSPDGNVDRDDGSFSAFSERVANGVQFGIWEWDLEAGDVVINDQWSEMVGRSDADFESDGVVWESRIHPEDEDAVVSARSGLAEGDVEGYDLTHRVRTPEDSWKWIRDVGNVVETGDDGDPERAVGIQLEISQDKERERELERQNERLSKFTSVVSHDLRNPLNVATGRVELAHEECDSEHLDVATGALERMNRLIDDLLTLAREGKSVESTARIDLSDISASCWQNVDTDEGTLEIDTERDLRADRSRLAQLLENLFRNAVEHGGEDVSVTIGDLENGFYVADDGPGIPAADRETIFESGYTTSEEGTGFGLSIVREIVQAHGWDIRVSESTAGGARFEIMDVPDTDE